MKRDKIIYWVTTSLVALSGLMAGIMYFFNPSVTKEFMHLGFPDYLRIELATAKMIGAFALILTIVPNRIKEWTYAGFAIVFISATIAHIAVDGAPSAIPPVITFLLLVISYVYFTKVNLKTISKD